MMKPPFLSMMSSYIQYKHIAFLLTLDQTQSKLVAYDAGDKSVHCQNSYFSPSNILIYTFLIANDAIVLLLVLNLLLISVIVLDLNHYNSEVIANTSIQNSFRK